MNNIPVLLLNFNRPYQTIGLIENLRLIKPKKVFISIDGPRVGVEPDKEKCIRVAECIKLIDWDCEIKTKISDTNLGLRNNVKTSMDWFFSENEFGII